MGKTHICYLNAKLETLKTAFEQAFFPDKTIGVATSIESAARRRGIHIHLAGCEHRGERWVEGAAVDGFHTASKTVFQFHGCLSHGCYPDRSQELAHGKTAEQLFQPTRRRTNALSKAGF